MTEQAKVTKATKSLPVWLFATLESGEVKRCATMLGINQLEGVVKVTRMQYIKNVWVEVE